MVVCTTRPYFVMVIEDLYVKIKRTSLNQRKASISNDIFPFFQIFDYFQHILPFNFRIKHADKLKMAGILTLTGSVTFQRAKLLDRFCESGAQKAVYLRKICQFSSSIQATKMRSQKNEKSVWSNSFYMYFLQMQLFLTKHLGKVLHQLTYFKK